MNTDYYKKEVFLLRFSGWLGLLPAAAYLYLWQNTGIFFFLAELIVIVLFSVFLLTTARSSIWTKPKNMMRLLIFALIFVAIIIAISLFFAYRNCQKCN